jgi:hypothetical protein
MSPVRGAVPVSQLSPFREPPRSLTEDPAIALLDPNGSTAAINSCQSLVGKALPSTRVNVSASPSLCLIEIPRGLNLTVESVLRFSAAAARTRIRISKRLQSGSRSGYANSASRSAWPRTTAGGTASLRWHAPSTCISTCRTSSRVTLLGARRQATATHG